MSVQSALGPECAGDLISPGQRSLQASGPVTTGCGLLATGRRLLPWPGLPEWPRWPSRPRFRPCVAPAFRKLGVGRSFRGFGAKSAEPVRIVAFVEGVWGGSGRNVHCCAGRRKLCAHGGGRPGASNLARKNFRVYSPGSWVGRRIASPGAASTPTGRLRLCAPARVRTVIVEARNGTGTNLTSQYRAHSRPSWPEDDTGDTGTQALGHDV